MKSLYVSLLALCLLSACAGVALAQQPVDVSGATCLDCHDNPAKRGVVQVYWTETAHPMALETLKASPQAEDACLPCHSADYALATAGARPGLVGAKHGVTCLACHPGDHRQNVSSAITDEFAACTKCHSHGAPLRAGEIAHHPIAEMLSGEGAPGVPPTPSEHAAVKDCTTCHREGHKFTVVQKTCNRCHDGKYELTAVQATVRTSLQRLQGDLERIKAQHADWDATAASKGDAQVAFEQALTLVSFVAGDGSEGLHNSRYTRAILEQAMATLEGAGLLAPPTLPATGSALPGPRILVVGGGVLIALGFLRRRGAR